MIPSEHSMRRRALELGRRRTPIRLGNPSKRIGSGLVPYPADRGIARQVWFAGELQFDLLSILMADRRVAFIDVEAPEIAWCDGLDWYRFRPPIVVHGPAERPIIYQTQWHANAVEFGIAEIVDLIRPYADRAGYADLVLETCVELRRPPRLYNAHLMTVGAASREDGKALEAVRVRFHASGGEPRTLAELTEGISSGLPETLRLAGRLIFDGDLSLRDPNARIGPEAILVAGNATSGASS